MGKIWGWRYELSLYVPSKSYKFLRTQHKSCCSYLRTPDKPGWRLWKAADKWYRFYDQGKSSIILLWVLYLLKGGIWNIFGKNTKNSMIVWPNYDNVMVKCGDNDIYNMSNCIMILMSDQRNFIDSYLTELLNGSARYTGEKIPLKKLKSTLITQSKRHEESNCFFPNHFFYCISFFLSSS